MFFCSVEDLQRLSVCAHGSRAVQKRQLCVSRKERQINLSSACLCVGGRRKIKGEEVSLAGGVNSGLLPAVSLRAASQF